MATLQLPQSGKAVRGRVRKTAPATDLTAMVDLAFLLITFFMLTTSLSRFQAMDIAKPVEADPPREYPASRTMTIVLGKNDKVLWYMGEAKSAEIRLTDFREVRKVFQKGIAAVKRHSGKDMLVILKPGPQSTYANFVDMIDELNISGITRYTIFDQPGSLLPAELHQLQAKSIQ